ncbi:MAG: type II and III secretion system protein family protein [Gammaproteobacteria bacterium]|nr:type II and III secretion system protein family protein [Gammaproteobacteria bacterium]MCW8839391.1 type II and III secretion system protein family protein [Gammaproteobacteria bacterium]MCW8957735.1 type II and III secretion system protein family protein [Gammaproteobacteria bacterium]MCW8972837.1 type II and III secretion system protein family protein [Gammaproteobacteria bacterium]MCW8992090.1 type II and III secretion system protein family protein [Gammaproteobacteria bacterium]
MIRSLITLLLAAVMVLSASAMAATGNYMLEFGGARDASELRLSIGKSQIIYSPRSLEQVVIGNPEIADIKLLSSRQVLILGKKPGHTNLVFRDKQRDLNAVIDVVVGYDLDGIKRKIYEVLPHERLIEIRGANDAVMLSGEVSSLASMDQAVSVASSFVPKAKVINMLQVGGGQQVMLEVKISEIGRSSLRELGVGIEATNVDAAGRTIEVITGNDIATNFFSGTSINTANDIADILTVKLQALETKGLAKTLAEPNIVALSGQEASFLAGGEFPVPVAQSGTLGGASVITVDYKEFGVGLRFTPTVLSKGKINLKLNSEVSAIDTSTSTATGGGISVPGITTRRTGTTVEVADGQSFAIAGLIQSDMNNAIDQIPGLGDIPILGALFRSTRFQRNETELVVVVTPRLVKPVNGMKLRAPTDNFIPPSWFDQYLLGRMANFKPTQSDRDAAEGETTNGDSTSEAGQSGQGVEGSFGHEL